MRRARQDEVEQIADFIVERFKGLEQFTFLCENFANAEMVLRKVTASELSLFFDKGDVFIEDTGGLQAVFIAIKASKYTWFHMVWNSLKTQKYLKDVPKSDLVILKEKMKVQSKIHKRNWYKKYSKHCYYITQIAISKEQKGTGLFRKMLTPILEECQKNGMCIALETFTKNNVSLYEHFGFALVETHTDENVPFSEYCMIKRNE